MPRGHTFGSVDGLVQVVGLPRWDYAPVVRLEATYL